METYRIQPAFVVFGMLLLLVFPVPTQADDDHKIPTRIEREEGFSTGAWKVERQWDRKAEKEFSAFVEAVGRAREKGKFKLAKGLANPEINPLYTEEDKTLEIEVDCANLPYLMRAYFAYKKKLPYSFQSNKCKRYKKGNRPKEFSDFSQYPDFRKLAKANMSAVSSGHFRMQAALEGTDTYPIEPDSETLVPGVVFYDPNGHVLLVYRIDPDKGQIFMLDGHPDGSMSRKVFGASYARGSARFGGGFKAWRHYYVDVLDQEKGSFVIQRVPNAKSFGYSDSAQYQSQYWEDGLDMTYHEWVQSRISTNGVYVDAVGSFDRMLDSFCSDVQDRVRAVERARRDGIAAKPHPHKLPWNIYGAGGEWEKYSSPGRDTRVRFKVKELATFVKRSMQWAKKGDKRLQFTGTPEQLQREFLRIWTEKSGQAECQFAYTNSAEAQVQFSLDDVMDRLYAFSFDPYHCPELRWGAPLAGPDGKPTAEFSTCPDKRRKTWWYEREQRLRNRTTRLLRKSTMVHRGPEQGEDNHIPRLLACYREKTPDFMACHGQKKLAEKRDRVTQVID